MPPTDSAAIARSIAKEYAEQTDRRLETYFEHTTNSMDALTQAMGELAKSVQRGNEQLVRYEERQVSTAQRMERIERTVRDLGVHQRESDRMTQKKIGAIEKDVRDNTSLRKGMLWLIAVVLAALITAGVAVFHPINNQPQTTAK